jgi:hypothetical protein
MRQGGSFIFWEVRGVNRHDYALRKELKRQNNIAAGLVSERFPAVSSMVFHMTYYRKAVMPVLMVRTLHFFPASYAYFNMDCMIKGCNGGGFDLTSVVARMVKTHKKEEKGTLICHGCVDAVDSDHASIEFEAEIRYKRKS